MVTAITNARVFDGHEITGTSTVLIDAGIIRRVGGDVPANATVVDGGAGTLLPGLIDSHCHTSMGSLRLALRFGVTTELDMMGYWPARQRRVVAESDDLADVRTAGMGITAPGGHPTEYAPPEDEDFEGGEPSDGHGDAGDSPDFEFPFCSTPEETVRMIEQQVANGSDYIKILIEDGTVVGYPGLPVVSDEVLATAVKEAHRHDRLIIAHATKADAARRAVRAGVDGLGHLFVDGSHPDLVSEIAEADTFVIPTLTVVSSALGHTGAAFAADPRVSARLPPAWLESLRGSANVYPQGRLEDALATVAALRAAGVDLLAGTDTTAPMPGFGGMAHGASVHHELQLLVSAGLTPMEALRAATSTPARRFGLIDRGRIVAGARADLLLVDGDPTTIISDTLSIRAVWRRGVRQPAAA